MYGLVVPLVWWLPAGILYTSKETHYSVMKAARMYRMDAIEVNYFS